jgi:hypothetical protein
MDDHRPGDRAARQPSFTSAALIAVGEPTIEQGLD